MLGSGSGAWAYWLPIPGVIFTVAVMLALYWTTNRKASSDRLALVILLAGITMTLKSPLGDNVERLGVPALQVLLTYGVGLTMTRQAALASAEMTGRGCTVTRTVNGIYTLSLITIVSIFVGTTDRAGFAHLGAETASPAALLFTLAFYIPHGIFSGLSSWRLAQGLRSARTSTRTRTRSTALAWLLVATSALDYDVLVHLIAVVLILTGHLDTWFLQQFSLVQGPGGAVGPLAAAIAGFYWLALPARWRYRRLQPGWTWLVAAAPTIVLSPPPQRPDARAFRCEAEVREAVDMITGFVPDDERASLLAHTSGPSWLPLLRHGQRQYKLLLIIALGRQRIFAQEQRHLRAASPLPIPRGSWRMGRLLRRRTAADRAVGRYLQHRAAQLATASE